MKHLALTVATSVTTALLLTGCGVVSQATSQILPAKDPNPPKALTELKATAASAGTLWQVSTGSPQGKSYVRIHPYVDDSAIIVAGAGTASAWDKRSGAALWRTPISETVTAGVNGGEGLVFVGTSSGSAVALDRNSGQVRWVERLSSEILSVSSAAYGKVVFRTADGRLHGLSTQTGEKAWEVIRRAPTLSVRGAGVPVIQGNMLVSGFDNGTVGAFDLQSGKQLWEATLSVPRGSNDLDRITDIDGRIKVINTGIFAASYNGQIAGLGVATGNIGWSQPFSTHVGVDVDPQGQGLYASSKTGNVWKIEPRTGAPVWKVDDFQRRKLTAPTLLGNYVVVGDFQGYLHWINTTNGQVSARLRSDPSGYTVPPVADGNAVYTFGRSGVLAAHSIR